jgi:hypothetical protein
MLKPIIIACAICSGAGGTALLVKMDAGLEGHPPAEVTTEVPSFQQVHTNAHLEFLPVVINKEAR